MGKDKLWWLTFALISGGLLLWGINWWANRPLFLDEANIARNLYDQSFAGLFSPLEHRQYAPPLYLMLAKACGELFGYTERSLRLPAMLGGILAIHGLIVGGKALKLRWWTLLPLALLFINPTAFRFVGEVKSYGLDLGVAALLIGYGLKDFRPNWQWAIAGSLSIWLSLPAVFVLAAIGSHYFYVILPGSGKPSFKLIRPWILTGGAWLASFAILYLAVLAPSIGSKYLNVFHGPYFFPLPGEKGFWFSAGKLLMGYPKLAFGHTALAIGLGGIIASGAIIFGKKDSLLWLLLPLLFVTCASSFGYFSLLPRLLLFTLPGWWLLAAQLSQQLASKLPRSGSLTIIGLWLLIMGGTNVLGSFTTPASFSDARALTWELEKGYQPILHHGAVPGFDYYSRIHPKGPRVDSIPSASSIRVAQQPGDYVLLYDVLTQGNIRVSVQRDSTWAAERGCRVRVQPFFRAKAVYVTCN